MSYPTELETLLDEGRIVIRSGLKASLGSGTYGFWNGKGDIEVEGVVYRPNSLISIDEIPMGMGTQAVPLRITMTESADFGITPDILAQIENEDYKGRPVVVYDFFFHPDTRALLHAEPLHGGYIDTIDHERDSGEAKLVANVETSALDNHRDGYRSASTADQDLISPGDLFFEHAATTPFETFKITFPSD